jgi:hypothetical protein
MLTVKALRVVELLWNSSSMNETAGANIEEANGEMNVIEATRPSKVHLRLSGKFSGMRGSSWLSHPTIPLSRSVSGIFSLARPSFFLLLVLSFEVIRASLLLALPAVLIRSMRLPSADFRRPVLIDSVS